MSTTEKLLLLRHARAGRKLSDRVLDFDRGLDQSGEAVAALLPDAVLEHIVPTAIVSSPYRRCVDTVRPLSQALQLPVHEDERLGGTRARAELRRTLRQLPANAVICTHGEIIETLFDDAIGCAKGAFWIIERNAAGMLVPALYVEPPVALSGSR